jgi:hypothetical protein
VGQRCSSGAASRPAAQRKLLQQLLLKANSHEVLGWITEWCDASPAAAEWLAVDNSFT